MESNKIDTLFKTKLDRQEETVSSDAWSRVESQLQSKKKGVFVKWYVAASIGLLLICTAGLFINQFNQSEPTIALSPIRLENAEIAFNNSQVSDLETIPMAKHSNKENITQAEKVNGIREEIKPGSLANNELAESNTAYTLSPIMRKQPVYLEFAINGTDFNQPIAKVNSKIIVEINFKTKKQSEFEQQRNKLKSLASELSIADLRASKNELFASALNFDKKQIN